MKHLLLSCILLSVCLSSNAQFCKLLTSDKDLSSSLINDIHQDAGDMIWIATEDGLNRYDGVKTTIYKHDNDNEHSLLNNFVRVVFEDSKQHLLIGSHDGLQLYDPGADNFSTPATYPDGSPFVSNIVSIVERKNGEIWVSGDRLARLTIKGEKLTVDTIQLPTPLSETDFMAEDSRGNMWVAKEGVGVYRITADGKMKCYLRQTREIATTHLWADSRGDVYVATMGHGLLRYVHEKDEFVSVKYPGSTPLNIKALYPLGTNDLLIGTDGRGVKLYDITQGSISDYLFDNYFFDSSTAKVHSILRDNNGNLWFAIYQKGVIMIPSSANSFKYIGYKSMYNNIIGSNYITSICKDSGGTTWIGTDNDGIYGIAGGRQLYHFKPGEVPPTIMSIFEDSKGNIWVGSFARGMGRLLPSAQRFESMPGLKDNEGNLIQRIYQFAEDNHGRLWIATMGAGLFYIDLNKGTGSPAHFEASPKSVNEWIGCLYHDPSGKLYCGTYDGVAVINTNSPSPSKQDVKATILTGKIAFTICGDSRGNIWIGCSDGLYRYNERSNDIRQYTTKDGLPSNTIYAIQEDLHGDLWISTNYGLSRLYTSNEKFVNYYVNDGLQSNEFSKNTSFKEENGVLWFGGISGITYFNPKEIVSPTKKWHIRITDFYVQGKPVRVGMKSGRHNIIDCPVYEATTFHLAHSDNSFTIEFSTQELNSPERITYMYALSSDEFTTLPTGETHITFSNMKPGTYKFRIKAADGDLISDTKEITIRIDSPWYQTWWAYLIYLLILALVVRHFIQQARHKAKVKLERLEHQHKEEINEAKLQFFINISHEIRTPMSLIISPLQ